MTQSEILARVDAQARRALLTGENDAVRELLAIYREAIDQILREVSGAWEEMEQLGEADPRTAFLHWKIRKESDLMARIQARLDDLQHSMTSGLSDALVDAYEEQFYRDAYAIDLATPPEVTVQLAAGASPTEIDAMMASPWKGAMFSDRVWALTDDMAAEIQNQLGQAMLLGESVQDAKRRIKRLKVLDGNVPPDYAIERLVRTEILKAEDRARERLYGDNDDLVSGEQVVTAVDERTCEWCGPMDHLDLESDEVQKLIEDGDLEDRPPFHPQCRCTTIPMLRTWKDLLGPEGAEGLEDFGDTERVVRGPDGRSRIVPFVTFPAWLQQQGLAVG